MTERVKISKILDGGLDVNLSGIDKTANGGYSAATVKWQLVALVGIYQELKTLNSLLACPNFKGIPASLRAIKRQTARIPTIAKPRVKPAKKRA
jgi:hypothetical protein